MAGAYAAAGQEYANRRLRPLESIYSMDRMLQQSRPLRTFISKSIRDGGWLRVYERATRRADSMISTEVAARIIGDQAPNNLAAFMHYVDVAGGPAILPAHDRHHTAWNLQQRMVQENNQGDQSGEFDPLGVD